MAAADRSHATIPRLVVRGTDGGLVLSGNQIAGDVELDDNITDEFTLVVAGNRVAGRLSCTGNTPPPVNHGVPNEVAGWASGQCADL